MHNTYNVHNLEANFKEYLEKLNYSRTSISNYIADIRKFLAWYFFMLGQQGLNYDLSYLSRDVMKLYQDEMNSKSIPVKTMNRQLSSLRTFAKFCMTKGYIATNPFGDVPNMKEEQSRQFSGKLASFSRTIGVSLAGYFIVLMLFVVPLVISKGTAAWSSVSQGLLAPSDLPAIDQPLKQQVASTSADLMTIPMIDQHGYLNLTASYPKILGHEGTLSIEAPQIKLQTTGDNPITFSTENGTVQFLFEGSRPKLPYESAFYFAGNQLESGNLIYGQTESTSAKVNLLELSSGLPSVSRFRVDSEGNVHVKGNIILDGNLIMSPESVIFGTVASETATSSASSRP